MAAQRSLSCDALYDDTKTVFPGATLWWLGDPAHREHASGHNPDDTFGVMAEEQDDDNLQEVRAIDAPVAPNGEGIPGITRADMRRLRIALTEDPRSRARTKYVIFEGLIWSRTRNFVPVIYTGTSDKHFGHLHWSGRAADDDNGSHWAAVLALGEDMATAAEVWNEPINNSYTEQPDDKPAARIFLDSINKSAATALNEIRDTREEVAALGEQVTSLAGTVTELASRPALVLDDAALDGIADRIVASLIEAATGAPDDPDNDPDTPGT